MVAVGCRPNVITCGSLIDGLCKTGKISVAIKLHEEMVNGNVGFGVICRPNVVIYNSIINGLCKARLIEKARELYLEMKSLGISPDVITYSTLVHCLCSVGDWEKDRIGDARALFNSITRKGYRPDVVCYTTLINWYGKNKEVKRALYLYQEMILEGIRPDVITYNALLIGLFLKGAGQWDLPVGTIDMTTLQSREIWSGVTYAVVVTMIYGDLVDMRFQIAIEIYDATWFENGLKLMLCWKCSVLELKLEDVFDVNIIVCMMLFRRQ
ncbi:pentatricopeptide repeat-containing protein At1g63330-like [Pistacia vera]|uniref:pentatricopeptide repeat-containing protein At1g63330-like n=1 Tax=Pistacia vera TaxID=55513 RepID=UPI001263C308|nr:pentatricopeptide repeat-containing protein At1g63330-like [Pistacia vera]